jgi:hypothetical protein
MCARACAAILLAACAFALFPVLVLCLGAPSPSPGIMHVWHYVLNVRVYLKAAFLCFLEWVDAVCITALVSVVWWCIHIVMLDIIEQTIISQHGLMGTQRARGTAVETDNGQSHTLRVGTASQIHKTKIINHIATGKESVGQLQKEEELQDMHV